MSSKFYIRGITTKFKINLLFDLEENDIEDSLCALCKGDGIELYTPEVNSCHSIVTYRRF
jgi:hypothetical protein